MYENALYHSGANMLTRFEPHMRPSSFTKKLPPFSTFKISCFSQNPNFLNMESQPNSKRPTCPNCSKPVSLCLCIRLKSPNLENNIHVTILQHSLEKKHPLNSARIAKLGLKNVDVFTVTDVNFDAQFDVRPLRLDCGFGLVDGECTPGVCGNAAYEEKMSRISEADLGVGSGLGSDSAGFPDIRNDEPLMSVEIGKSGKIRHLSHQWKLMDESKTPAIEDVLDCAEVMECLAGGFVVTKLQKKEKPGSIELEQFEEFEIRVPRGSAVLFPSENAVAVEAIDFQVKNLIVLDGTWSKAKRMYLENPWLRILPSVRLDVEKLSLFSEVRRQPKAGYLSTIESIVYALKALGETESLSGLDNLLEVFESMVEDQRRYKDESLAMLSST
ncbi:uncharacterized protein LOC141646864 [Silene latifolia]|uniref:uncharacterized protein LOC141646864 n=1 Tax=Silene latifolia TaxID=37657 RepID=UPI003D7808C4